MDKIEKIRQEIERRKKICEDIFERESDTYYQGKAVAYGELLPFIDSLPDEHLRDSTKMISEDERIRKELKEAFEVYDIESSWNLIPVKHILAWLEKHKEQKPAEWKPQPESLEALMYAIEGKWEAIKPTSYLSRRLEDLYDGLVNTFNVDESFIAHENDYVSKSAEWSEEDKDNLHNIKLIIENFNSTIPYSGGNLTPSKEYKQELISLLKSLRPSWKPSEHQMSMLLAVVNDPNNAGSASCHLSLKSLYNDLKKL